MGAKRFCIALCSLLSAVSVFADSYFGLSGGASLCWMGGDDWSTLVSSESGSSNRLLPSYTAGAFAEFPLLRAAFGSGLFGGPLSIRGELRYSELKGSFSSSGSSSYSQTWTIPAVEVSLLLKVPLISGRSGAPRLFVLMGPDVFVFSENIEQVVKDGGSSTSSLVAPDYSLALGGVFAIGGEAKLGKGWAVADFRYERTFSPFLDGAYACHDLSFSLGYKMPFNLGEASGPPLH